MNLYFKKHLLPILSVVVLIAITIYLTIIILGNDTEESKANLDANAQKWLESNNFANTNKFNYWGKVVDLNGNPIAGAKVNIYVYRGINLINEVPNGKKIELLTDENGEFNLTNEIGGGLAVKANKKGYAEVTDWENRQSLSTSETWFGDTDLFHNPIPSKDNPVALVLRKKNPLPNTFSDKATNIKLSKTGDKVEIPLKSKDQEIVFLVTSFSEAPVPYNSNDEYDWGAKIEVMNGKVQESTGFDDINQIEAPNSGYLDFIEIRKNKADLTTWKSGVRQNCWIYLSDGSYGKAHIRVSTTRKYRINIDLVHNLDGDRNFEK